MNATTDTPEGYERAVWGMPMEAAWADLTACVRCGRRLVAVPVLSRHGASAGPHSWLWRCQVCPSEATAA